MKKHTILTSLVAISMSCAAHAAIDLDTNVTFAGDYSNTDGTITGNISVAPDGESYTYQSTDKDGNLVSNTATYNSATDTGVSAANFKYQTADGSEASLADNANPAMSAYKATSNIDGTTIKLADGSTDVVYNGTEELSKELYIYEDSNGNWVSLATEPVSTKSIALSSEFAGETNVTITNGEATEFSGELYTFTDSGVNYRLNATGDKVINDLNQVITPETGSTFETKANAAMSAYNTDKDLIDAAVTSTGSEHTADQALYDAAMAVFDNDAALFADQKAKYATVEAAVAQWNAVNDTENPAWATAMSTSGEKTDLYKKATDLYNASIVETIGTGANAAIDSALADGGLINETINNAVAGKEDVLSGDKLAAVQSGINADKVSAYDSHITDSDSHVTTSDKTKWDAKQDALSDEQLTATNSGINTSKVAQIETNKSDIATNAGKIAANELAIAANTQAIADGDALTLNNAKSYADTQDAIMLNQAKAYADAQNSLALQSAKDYTDHKVDSLEKEVSAGIASATALSSVAVSNVKKGEMSIGGGYGYYNSQSAIALGAAMGISDNWSVNAGAGLSDGNVAFRAGTNYKFKLF